MAEAFGWLAAVGRALGRRPDLWSTAARQGRRLVPSDWWRRWPPVPRPAPEYLRFRAETMYGAADHRPEPADVVAWLDWCRREHRARGPHR